MDKESLFAKDPQVSGNRIVGTIEVISAIVVIVLIASLGFAAKPSYQVCWEGPQHPDVPICGGPMSKEQAEDVARGFEYGIKMWAEPVK
jgi:hypothetical protein